MAVEDDPLQQAWTSAEKFLADEGDWPGDMARLIERAENVGIPPGAILTFLMAYLSNMADQYGFSGEEMLVAVAFNRAAAKDEVAAEAVMREALERIVKKRDP